MQRKKSTKTKSSPYIIDTTRVNALKEHYGVGVVEIGRRTDMDPSTISRNIANIVRSLKVQRKLARYFVRLTKGAVTEDDIIIRPKTNGKKTAAELRS
jgi:DNA-binding MarR family transcriptional regulator